jgi:alpha-glucosidase
VLTAFLPGTSWLYQGEELGLVDGVVEAGAAADPLATADPSRSRDVARTPMPWAPGPGLGFTRGTPWLPDGGRTAGETVEFQTWRPDSPFSTVRRLLAVRRRLRNRFGAAFGHRLEWTHASGDLVMYRRGGITVAANLGPDEVALSVQEGLVVFDTDQPDVNAQLLAPPPRRLQPLQAVVVLATAAAVEAA